MAMTEDRKKYLYEYKKEKLKRVPLDLTLDFYNLVKSTAEDNKVSVNGYIKQAIAEKIERDSKSGWYIVYFII